MKFTLTIYLFLISEMHGIVFKCTISPITIPLSSICEALTAFFFSNVFIDYTVNKTKKL